MVRAVCCRAPFSISPRISVSFFARWFVFTFFRSFFLQLPTSFSPSPSPSLPSSSILILFFSSIARHNELTPATRLDSYFQALFVLRNIHVCRSLPRLVCVVSRFLTLWFSLYFFIFYTTIVFVVFLCVMHVISVCSFLRVLTCAFRFCAFSSFDESFSFSHTFMLSYTHLFWAFSGVFFNVVLCLFFFFLSWCLVFLCLGFLGFFSFFFL